MQPANLMYGPNHANFDYRTRLRHFMRNDHTATLEAAAKAYADSRVPWSFYLEGLFQWDNLAIGILAPIVIYQWLDVINTFASRAIATGVIS